MEHRHINHNTQINKPHSKKGGSRAQGGKVDNVPGNRTATTGLELGKEQRYNKLAQKRKEKREDLLLKRRGLNVITDQHEMNLDEDCINMVEKENDNVAPKIVGILGLSESCDIAKIQASLIDHCVDYMDGLRPISKKNKPESAEL